MVTFLTAIQCGVLIVAGLHIEPRWEIGGWLFFAASSMQFATLCSRLLKSSRTARLTAIAGTTALLTTALIAGLHIQVAVHIITTFTPIGAATGWAVLGGLAAALPWLLAFPIWQLASTIKESKKKINIVSALIIAVIGPSIPCFLDRGEAFEPIELQTIAEDYWSAISNGQTIDTGTQPIDSELIVTVIRRGENLPIDTVIEAGDALLIEAVTHKRRVHRHPLLPAQGTVLSPGQDGVILSDGSAISPRSLIPSIRKLKSGAAAWIPAVPNNMFDSEIEFVFSSEGWLTSHSSSSPVYRGWTSGEISPYDAALAGAHQLSNNSHPNGKFSYIIKGPSGLSNYGYNFPRHAGSTWFVAEMANRSQDESLAETTANAVGFMKDNTQFTGDGRAYILDPSRDDGKVWVGTTALGLLAFIEAGLEPDLQEQYTAFLASSVMGDGEVRGDMDIASESWPEQPSVTYAFGQVMLALSEAEAAGIFGAADALDRLLRYVEEEYWPIPAANMMILDEHWMCLATASIYKHRGLLTGEDICRAWLLNQEPLLPTSPMAPPAGFIGARSEAWTAFYSFSTTERDLAREQIESHAQLFLNSLYRNSDAPFLGNPESLIGGFRDTTWKLDVQMDAVQHIGFALLGAEEL